MQENHGCTIGGTRFNVADVEETCIDLLDRSERSIRARYVLPAGLCLSKATPRQCNSNDSDSGGDRHERIGQVPAIKFDLFRHFVFLQLD